VGFVSDDRALRALVDAIVVRDRAKVSRLLAQSPDLATTAFAGGATRQSPDAFFLTELRHHCYQGDTALHIAAAAHDAATARDLVAAGADVVAQNRRRAQPLHYAVDGGPSSNAEAQREIVTCLIELGATVDAVDANGSQPLHRAIRNRSTAAVAVLLAAGADANAPNKKGSTPMQLATWTTGKSGSGTAAAKAEQARIIELLSAAGARST
jgi:ankyrin repeat protein